MSVFVQISDFKNGRFRVAFNKYTEVDLQSYIDRYEVEVMYKLFGKVMAEELLADAALYPFLTQPFYEKIAEDLVRSEGLKFVITSYVYFHFVRDLVVTQKTTGISSSVTENSTPSSFASHDFTTRYNEGIESLKAIQEKAINEVDTYPLFDTVFMGYTLPI
jgi:hypothetical protein